jgi:two-component system CheB/CheR fusion protein
MQVLVWNNRAEDLWGLRREEAVGQHFLNLDIGLPTDRLRPVIKQVLSDGVGTRELAVEAVNRRGREVLVRISCSALRRNGSDPTGAILVMELDGHHPG